jgi:hypothetical protein
MNTPARTASGLIACDGRRPVPAAAVTLGPDPRP